MKNVCLIVIYVCSFAACKKTDSTSVKTDDQGTFYAKIDGAPVSPCIPVSNNSGPITTYFQAYNSSLFLLTLNEEDECDTYYYTRGRNISVIFDSVDIQLNTTYKLGNSGRGQITCAYYISNTYKSDLTLPGTITISKFDPVAKIIGGSFEGTLKTEDGASTVSLTDGKFDLKY